MNKRKQVKKSQPKIHQHKWVTISVDGGWLEECKCGASRFIEIEPYGFTTHEYMNGEPA